MENKKYLTEENYERGKKKISKIALIILIIGVLIGGSLIVTGIIKQSQINSKYSEESKVEKQEQLEVEKQKITEELATEKQNILNSKTMLENKIKPVEDQIKSLEREPFTGFNDAYYARQDKIEELEESIKNDKKTISVINDATSDSFNHCLFDETKNNSYTLKYCSLKKDLESKQDEINNLDNQFSDFKKNFDSHGNIPFYIFGTFVIIASCMVAGSIYMITKRREILAFSAQQVMPVAQEGIEKMAPTIGKAGASVAKEMAPVYGDIAKEISKGIKEGLKDEKNK